MASKSDESPGLGDIELLQTPSLPMTADAILQDFTHYFGRMLGRRTIRTLSLIHISEPTRHDSGSRMPSSA